MAIILLAGISMVYRSRVQNIRRAETAKTALSKQIAEIEMKAIRAQMNPHFLFNSLNSIRLLIDREDNESAKIYLTKFSKLIRQVLDHSKHKFIRLEDELNTLRLYLDLEKMRFKNFNYSITIGPEVGIDFVEIPPLLMQPYVENAIWHGLMHKEKGDRKLEIRIVDRDTMLEIIIEDNGVGRAHSASLYKGSQKTKNSIGLKMSEDRIKFLRDIYGSEASVEIIDLNDPIGTRVVIRFPVTD